MKYVQRHVIAAPEILFQYSYHKRLRHHMYQIFDFWGFQARIIKCQKVLIKYFLCRFVDIDEQYDRVEGDKDG